MMSARALESSSLSCRAAVGRRRRAVEEGVGLYHVDTGAGSCLCLRLCALSEASKATFEQQGKLSFPLRAYRPQWPGAVVLSVAGESSADRHAQR